MNMSMSDQCVSQEVGVLPDGRIDIHSHLLPGVDDGCRSLEESIECVTRLKAAGYVGTVCTPHVWPGAYPQNTPEQINAWTDQLGQQLRDAGIAYQLWAGGELRLFDGVIDWMQVYGVPTLARSGCVLVDMWEARWPKWAMPGFEWLIQEGYQPILAHPERLGCVAESEEQLNELAEMGVWLQGNGRCMTGEEGYHPDRWVRRFLGEDRYQFMALDMHGPDTLEARLEGLAMVAAEFGSSVLDRLTIEAPKRLILSSVR